MKYIILFIISLTIVTHVHAEYLLPYPSYMPGHKLYTLSRILDGLKRYWYFGTIAKTKYHQSLSDKYLVEAKTLFEYKQYPLALDALERSDQHFQKSTSDGAREAHVETLNLLKAQLPETFVWQDEHQQPMTLAIREALNHSIAIRNE